MPSTATACRFLAGFATWHPKFGLAEHWPAPWADGFDQQRFYRIDLK